MTTDLGRLATPPGSSPSGQAPTGLAGSAATIPSATPTPGPWKVSRTTEGVLAVCADTGKPEFPVAKFLEIIRPEVNEANARLIAAAPDMLVTLYQYVSDLRYPPQGDSIERRIAAAEAIIAKAVGRS